MRRASLLIVAASLLLFPTAAAADCTMSVTSVAFGTYSPTAATALDGTGGVRLDCRHNVTPIVAIATGNSGTYTVRRMTSGTSQLQYNLFTNAGRTIVWGNSTGGSVTLTPPITQSVGLRRIREAPIYGRVSPGQNVRAGTYTDAMFVTVSF